MNFDIAQEVRYTLDLSLWKCIISHVDKATYDYADKSVQRSVWGSIWDSNNRENSVRSAVRGCVHMSIQRPIHSKLNEYEF